MAKYFGKKFIVEKIGDQREFNRSDGTVGRIQRVENEDDHSLVIWDKDEISKTISKGDEYKATGIRDAINPEGYLEYHTGKYTKITRLDDINTLTGKPMGEEPRVVGVKPIPAESTYPILFAKELKEIKALILDLGVGLSKRLDDLAEMI